MEKKEKKRKINNDLGEIWWFMTIGLDMQGQTQFKK